MQVMARRLRYYPNAVKIVGYLVISLAFVAIGIWILKSPSRSGSYNFLMAWLTIGFSGLGIVVFSAMILAALVRRLTGKSALEFTPQGITYSYAAIRSQFVPWEDVRDIAIYRQQMTRTSMCYLVVNTRKPQQLPHSGVRAFTARMYPTLRDAALYVPLNTFFLVVSKARRAKMLKQIASTFAPELQHYGIQVDDQLRTL